MASRTLITSLRRRLRRSTTQIHRHFTSQPPPFDPPPIPHHRRVVVTGLGMVTPLGCGVGTAWRRLVEGRCGVRSVTPADLKMGGFEAEVMAHAFEQLTSKVAAIVPCGDKDGEFDEDKWLRSKDHKSMSRFIAYALCASEEALRDANWLPSELNEKEQTGVSIGGGIGSICDILDAAQMICEKVAFTSTEPIFHPTDFDQHGSRPWTKSCCCDSLCNWWTFYRDATRMIQFGDADVMVAGGTEASIDALSIAGFCRSRALATKYNHLPQESSRPFDCGRDGFVIGEGCGIMVLEEIEHAKKRGAKIYAEVRGYGMSGDAYHITQPHSDGRGAILAMTRALQQAGLSPNQVDYINAHATSTPLGDAVEANAIKSLFADHATSGALALSSTKVTLFVGCYWSSTWSSRSCGSNLCSLAIYNGIAPPTLNLVQPDPLFQDGFMPLNAAKSMPINAALSNSFGFGGTNASLLFTSAP
ncbi:hypothetical protein QJS10_CPA10g01909 [Acorus calamus]|uniref:beta-ketoacyl-[acyl-carrier-protein] synthase I n=1 Tax=Acorus calamus TaxID=4465 RepID=A0AAV9E1F6_ACOCL|nr:hypothetical protein QJS10_CPA10g01909 [Acorus calamus]